MHSVSFRQIYNPIMRGIIFSLPLLTTSLILCHVYLYLKFEANRFNKERKKKENKFVFTFTFFTLITSLLTLFSCCASDLLFFIQNCMNSFVVQWLYWLSFCTIVLRSNRDRSALRLLESKWRNRIFHSDASVNQPTVRSWYLTCKKAASWHCCISLWSVWIAKRQQQRLNSRSFFSFLPI